MPRLTQARGTTFASGAGVNIADMLSTHAEQHPSRICLLRAHGQDWQRLDYAQMAQRVAQTAHRLQRLGVCAGAKTWLALPPTLDFFVLAYALFKIGAVPVFIDPRMGRKNLRRCLQQLQLDVLIATPVVRLLLRVIVSLRVSQALTPAICLHTNTSMHTSSWQAGEKDIAAITFTSGSTGTPKGVLYTHHIFTAQLAALRAMFAIKGDSYDLATFPLFALFGPLLGRTTVLAAMDMTRPARADPALLLAALRRFNITSMFCSPAVLDKLAIYGKQHDIGLPSLRQVICAGAPVNPRILQTLAPLLPADTQVFTPYGATEALPVTLIGSHKILRTTAQATAQGAGICIGKPLAAVDVKIIAVHDGALPRHKNLHLAQGEIGEIAVNAAWLSRSYYDNAAADREARYVWQSKTYHRMGDLGYCDSEGQLWYCGRKSQRVQYRAGTLYTVCCEGVFNAHAAVKRSALIAINVSGQRQAGLCVETLHKQSIRQRQKLRQELQQLAQKFTTTEPITHFYFLKKLPVDRRHNAKILRERLTHTIGKC